MVMTVTDILNIWNQMGVFSYVIPFLLMFAVIFAVIQKSKIFAKKEKDGEPLKHNATIEAIIAAAIGLLALQFDIVSVFFADIFPKFGVGLSVFLVLLIFFGMFYKPIEDDGKSKMRWIAWLVGLGVLFWTLSNWTTWFGGYNNYGFGGWLGDYFWPLVILVIVIGGIIGIIKASK
ncbi:MAG: hypothetical protein NUV97_03820 [archaeon]|nr:hypothetical protein [archaeon]MCR4323854.1 hypothetical protein [Nanoarchaeota archaeon]